MAVDVGSAVGYLDLDISGFLAGLKSANSEANKQTKNIATTIGNNISSAGKKLSSIGSTLTKTVTLPIVGAGTAVVKLSSDFESAMSKVSAISGATGNDLDRLNKKAQEMGAKTKFSATEAAEAFTYMAMAGWKTEAMIEGIDGIMNLAAADGLDLATTSDIVTDALTAFGLEAKDSAHFADVLAKAASNANTNVSLLGESFKYAAPVAGALGYSAEDTAIALGLMANAGIKGSQGGTALRSSLSRLIKPTDEVEAKMQKYNLSLTKSDGSMKSLGEVMTMLRENLGGLAEAEQASTAAALFGQEAMSGMLSIINASDADFNKLTSAIYDADGAAEQMAETMLDNLSGQITILKSSLEGLALQFGEIILPYIKKAVSWIQELIQKLQKLTPEQKEQIVKWGAIAAAVGPVLLVFGKLVSGTGNVIATLGKLPGAATKVTTGFKNIFEGAKLAKAGFPALGAEASKLGAAIGGITAPVVAVIAIIAALIAAFVSLWKNNEDFRNKIIAIWDQIKATFEKLTSGIVERLNKLGFDFENIGEVLKAIWKGFCDFLAPIFEGVFQYIADTFDTIVNVILGIVDFFIAVFTGDWQGAWDAVKGIFESVWNGIVSWFENITNTIIGVAQTVLGWFGVEWNTSTEEVGNTFKNIWQSVADFFTNLWNGIKDFFTGLIKSIWNTIKPLFEEIAGAFQMAWDVIKLIWDYVQPYFAGIWEGIKAVFAYVGEWFKMIFNIAWEGIKAVWSVVVSWFTLLWNNIKAIFSVVGTWFKGVFSVAWEAIKAVWNSVVAFFTMIWAGIKAVFAVVKGVLSGNFEDAWNAIKNLWDKAKNFFSTVWNGIKNVFSSVVSFFSNTFSSAWEAIKKVFNNFGTFFSNLWNTIKNTFSALGTKIGDAISGAVKAGINGVLGMIEGVVNTFVRMINGAIDLINLIPGVKIGYLSQLRIPRLAKGGVVDRATLAMFGEDGREAVIPLEKNLGWMKNLVAEFMARLEEFFNKQIKFNQNVNELISISRNMLNEVANISRQLSAEGLGYTSYYGFTKSRNVNKANNNPNNPNESTGDTFNFYSPKPIDEIEAAKQMKKTKRELAEGF